MNSPFSKFADSPFKIQHEGETITVKFNRTSPSTGKVTWTLPIPEAACDKTQPIGYNGVIVTLDTNPTDPSKFPIDGSRYVADPSGNTQIHAGDKIGSALVVGAFYDDISTVEMDLVDLDPLQPYYISLHAVDAQLRYHMSGVHSYSLNFGNTPKLGLPGYQIIKLGDNLQGVVDTDLTGLDPAVTYMVKFRVNGKDYDIELLGSNISTYAYLIHAINIEAGKLSTQVHSVTPPNAFGLYLNTQKRELYRWSGTAEVRLPNLYFGNSDPSSLVDGAYVYNNVLGTVYQYDASGSSFTPLMTFNTSYQPNDPTCGFVWYDGITAHNWIGVWQEAETYTGAIDPSLPLDFDCTIFWYNPTEMLLQKREKGCNGWANALAILSPTDPTVQSEGDLWMDEKNLKLFTLVGGVWVNDKIVKTNLAQVADGEYYFTPSTGELLIKIAGNLANVPNSIVWYQDPLNLKSGTLWWDEVNSDLYMWQKTSSTWVLQVLKISDTDPRFPIIETGSIWIQGNAASRWNGTTFTSVNMISSPNPINSYTNGLAWINNGTFKVLVSGVWTSITPMDYDSATFNAVDGSFWYNPITNELFERIAGVYNSVPFSLTSLKPKNGTVYFNTYLNKLLTWNGYGWIDGTPLFVASLTEFGHLKLETSTVGSGSFVTSPYYLAMGSGTYPMGPIPDVFLKLTYPGFPEAPVEGSDPQSAKPSYMEVGVGTDGTDDERREMIDSIRYQLGYPQVEVELTKLQMDNAIANAIETLRQRSGMCYKNAYMFFDLTPGVQGYQLTNRRLNHHKIVSVNKIIRMRAAFMSTPQGSGVYGQMALQQMYQMGSYDLISHHLVSQYVETANELFAAEITFGFNESNRTLTIYKNIFKPERVLVSVSTERTEQDLFKDRYLRQWIQGYAKAQCRYMLAEIRGKYGSLPGAGGGVSLNAGDLSARADMEMVTLMQELDDFIVTNPEDYSGSTVMFG